MANIPIRDIALTGVPSGSAKIVFDDGQMKAGLVSDLADGVRPVASQSEAQTGSDNAKTMTPLRVKESIASEVGVSLASKAQGDLANAALQPSAIGGTVQGYDSDLAAIAGLSPSNDDILQRKSGAWTNRTAAQVKADLGLATVATSGAYGDLSGKPTLGSAAAAATTDFATAAQGAKADSAVQPGSLGTAATKNVGTAAGNVVQLDGSGKLPAVDGSQLTGLAGGGDMLASVYDPTGKASDAFNLDNMSPAPSAAGKAYFGAPTVSFQFATVAAASAATIPAIVARISTAGYYAAGDGGGSIATNATYERVGSLPAHSGYIHSADGAYWELTGRRVSVRQFGAVPVVSNLDTDPDAAAAINLCMAYCNLKHTDMLIPSGQWPLDSAITSPTFIVTIQGEQGGAQPTILYKRYVEANASKGVISLGAWGATVTDLQFAAKSGVSGGSAVSAILPNVAANIGMLHIERLYVSGGDGFNHDLYINGLANTNAAGPGYRSVFMNGCHFFGSAVTPIYLQGVEHLYGTDWFVATTGGTNSSGFILIIDGSAASYGDDIQISSGLLSGNVNVNQTSRSMLMMRIDGNLTISSSCSGIVALSVGGTISNSGTSCYVINEYNAWLTATPTPTSSAGTLTSASSTVAYKKIGKTVFCNGIITVATVGTGSGALRVQLPFTLKRLITLAGKEDAVNGLAFAAEVNTSGVMSLLKYDNTSHIAAGATFPFQFVAELT